ncbi:gamma-aminobutyric acid type B receptor subunit 2-like isoform X2 [Amphibalanus amphitrite]|uniref:gamma-aminobutyric acid type B receptor subunit 2-like isoform X2 n=1 Tax=Amphibalanus amphitrite TaxID=1232801 RepID=UPI001C8FD526|nr:gamma-aminobutyric acid type B receptor subunit 2-like isoform X2 [Amphibalanus amphitrite]
MAVRLGGPLPLLLLLAAAAAASSRDGKEDIHIAGFFPMTAGELGVSSDGNDPGELGRGVMHAVELAVKHVNKARDVLPSVRLHVTWNNTQCSSAVAMKAFFDMMSNGSHKMVLFGAACTHVTDPIAKASKHWNLAQLSYANTHPMFTKRNFPNFYRIVPNVRYLDVARVEFVKLHGWKRVGTLCQDDPRYTLAHNGMVKLLDTFQVDVVAMETFAGKLTDQLEKLKAKDVRIVLGSFDESWARRIFCEARRVGMFGRRYQWLLVGLYSERWWERDQFAGPEPADPAERCSPEDVVPALQGAVLTDVLHLSNSRRRVISGMTASEYKKQYDHVRGKDYSRFHGYAYDGIWAIASALHQVTWRIRHNQSPLPSWANLSDFRYQDERWETVLKSALNDISFEGVTGSVKFSENERRGFVVLKQFRDNRTSFIGVHDLNQLRWLTPEDDDRIEPIWWFSGKQPLDQTIRHIEKARVNVQLYAALVVAASLGIVMAVIFLFINIRFRNQRYIKMSSPYLNNLIIIGCILTYTSVILLGLDSSLTSEESFPVVCAAKTWVLMAGFTLAFGSMFSKTWRVHSIFTDVKLNKKVIKDYQLYIVVGVLLSIDIAIMTTWQIVDPFYRETKQLGQYPHPQNDDAIIIPENEYCKSHKMTVFVGCIYAYKGLLMIFGCFLAWETRHVNIAALNDSKYIGMSVYNVVIMCVIGVAISFVLSDDQDASFIIISVFILFCTTGTLCLVFVPKLIELQKSKRAPPGRLRATLKPPRSRGYQCTVNAAALGIRENIRRSEDMATRLRLKLRALEQELDHLMRQVGDEAQEYLNQRMAGARLTVPRLSCLGMEGPSMTESTEITSLCSYTEYDVDAPEPSLRKRSSVQHTLLPSIAASTDNLGELPSPPTSPFVPFQRNYLVANGLEVELGNIIVENVDEPSCYAVKDGEESLAEEPAVELLLGQSAPAVHKFGRSSLDCVMHHGLLSVPASDEPLLRRRSDPGVRQYSLASAINALNASLANIINATSYSTVTNNSSSISRFIEEAAFQALHSSSSDPSHLEGGDVGDGADLDSPPPDDDSDSARLGESSGPSEPSGSSAEATTRSLDSLSAECGDSDLQSVSESAPPPPGHALLVNGDVLQMLRMRNSQLSVKPVAESDGGDAPQPDRSSFSARSSASCPRLLGDAPLSLSAAPAGGDGPLSGAILPIFHKLVSERQRARPAPVHAAASCPNITVKCDIVQYL